MPISPKHEAIIASSQMMALSLMDTICALACQAAAELGDPKLGEFITYRAEQARVPLERAPLTLEDLIEARDSFSHLKDLLVDLRDRCGNSYRKTADEKLDLNAMKATTATAIASCALYNACSELINTAGSLAASNRIEVSGDGEITFGRRKPKHGEPEGPNVTIVTIDEDGSTTEKNASMDDLPPEVLKGLMETLKRVSEKKKGDRPSSSDDEHIDH